MVDRVKIEPKIITIHKGRLSFMNNTTPTYRTNKFGQPDKGTPERPKKPQYRLAWLLDPSDAQAAETIKEIKAEAIRQLDLFFRGRENWPKDNATTGTKGIIRCFGNGNDLAKVYDGYKDMFYVKVADTTRPITGDRYGRQVELLSDGAWHVVDRATKEPTEEVVKADSVPYAGCYARGRISLYVYNNEQAGVNGNLRSVQFLEAGSAFGGGQRNADEELAAMTGDAPKGAAPATEDPW